MGQTEEGRTDRQMDARLMHYAYRSIRPAW